jgi:alkanesulfonate monooxygenase SsuD/methylene tetrahydromethanopterin reductase-like flavin-dependent oxidoreductase (luciferase family)
MKLGLFAMPCHPPHRRHAATFDEDLDMLVLADQLGFEEAWIGEHTATTWENIAVPELLIAQALERTRQIKLGTGVSCIPNHNPVTLAARIAQIDIMAKGRFLWGIGVGATPGDGILYEVDQTGPHRDASRERVDVVLRIWADEGEGFSWSSDSPPASFTLPKAEPDRGIGYHLKPLTLPHPPIAVAGISRGSSTLRWAGERNWIPMSLHFLNVADLRSHWTAYSEAAEGAGHTPDRRQWRICRDIYLAETDEQARAEVLESSMTDAYRQYFFPLLRSVEQTSLWYDRDDMQPDDVTIEYLLATRWVVGSPDTVVRQLRALYEDVGGFGGLLLLCYDWEGANQERWRHSMELLANEVMPRLADLTGVESASSVPAAR